MEGQLIYGTTQTVTAHQDIKATLDQGNLDYFGMTSGYDFDNVEDPTEGPHVNGYNYALQKNPNIKIFIAIPVIDLPATWRCKEYTTRIGIHRTDNRGNSTGLLMIT